MFDIDPESDLGQALASYDRRAQLIAHCVVSGLEPPILEDEPIEVLNPLAKHLAEVTDGDLDRITTFAAKHLPIELAAFVMIRHGVAADEAISRTIAIKGRG